MLVGKSSAAALIAAMFIACSAQVGGAQVEDVASSFCAEVLKGAAATESDQRTDSDVSDWIAELAAEELEPLDRCLTYRVAAYVDRQARSEPRLQGLQDTTEAQRTTECVMAAFGNMTTSEKRIIAEAPRFSDGIDAVIEHHPALESQLTTTIDSCLYGTL